MDCRYACGTADHKIARRGFLGTLAAAGTGVAVGGLGAFTRPVAAAQLAAGQKRIVVFNMHGGLSQLESWDPKPKTPTGGPFRAIPTSVTGLHVSELLPQTAKQMHHLTVVRGVDTSEDDHAKGAYLMMTGRRQMPGANDPQIGAVVAKALAPADSPLPGHVLVVPWGGGSRGADAAYLGTQYASLALGKGNPPPYLDRPANVSDIGEAGRHAIRRGVNERFLARRRTAMTDAYTHSYEQALRLMAQKDTFDVTKEPAADIDRYGKHDFGRHCLLARRLLEKGVTFVQVTHTNYDTHNENFDFHLEQLGEFDSPFATFVADLADRGMLDSTLIVVLSEFGRTPNVNLYYGRDHWSKAWSVVLGGAKIPRGHVFGATNENGTEVTAGKVDHGMLFHTYLEAVGVDSAGTFDIDGREVPVADPAAHPIEELIA
jgi:hypothetical protein